ncbi:glycoside hydrolase, partial [Martensiomyces pterosporus]
MLVSHLLKALCYAYCSYSALALAFNISSNSNYVSYYGQNSGRNQKPLGEYCQDTIEDVIVLSFMNGFPGVLMNFANACETTFPGSTLLHCPTIASDIKYCQSRGKAYYIAAAPQCPFPDAYVGSTLNSAWFDMVFVQFYNNYCGLNAYPGWFNFGDWDNWAKTQSINKDVRVFIGAPGSPSAASSGYIDGSTLGKIYKDMLAKHTSLGGIMTWDVSQSRTSGIANTIR